MAESQPAAKTSPLVWVLLVLVFALALVFLWRQFGHPASTAAPAAAPAPAQAAPDSARSPAWQPPAQQPQQGGDVQVG